MDGKRQAWLTLHADGTLTWQPALGSIPLAVDHEIPESMPTAARLFVNNCDQAKR